MKRNGRWWVLGLLGLGVAAALFAVSHWSKPENAVRWTFTQLHTSLLRKRMDAVRQIVGDRVLLDGLPLGREDFIAAYVVPSDPSPLATAPCSAVPGHWTVTMGARAWCFEPRGRGWWLHRVGPAPCDGR